MQDGGKKMTVSFAKSLYFIMRIHCKPYEVKHVAFDHSETTICQRLSLNNTFKKGGSATLLLSEIFTRNYSRYGFAGHVSIEPTISRSVAAKTSGIF